MIRIVADSSCDISQEEAKKLNVEIIPLPIEFNNETFFDGINLSTSEFYQKLTSSKILPTTSQPSPLEFLERFEEAKKNGDSVLVITLSSKISGEYNSACMCKRDVGYEKIEIVDSLTTIGGMQMIIKEAVRLRDEGKLNVHELAEYLNKFKLRSRTIASIDTLEYLSKGGRLSGTARIIGTMLNIKPIISVTDGFIKLIDKKIGSKNAQEYVLSQVKNAKIDFNYPIYLGYSVHKKPVEYTQERLKEMFGVDNFVFDELSVIVGTHIGPGACAIIYIVKEED